MRQSDPAQLHIIAIGYAKPALIKGSREWQRLRAYATQCAAFHQIVFTRAREGYKSQHEENFHIHATNSLAKLFLLYDAYRMGVALVRKNPNVPWVVTGQDPFEAGVVAKLIAWRCKLPLHLQLHNDFFAQNAAWRTESLGNRLRYYVGRYLLQQAAALRTVSERIKHSVQALGAPETKLSILPVYSDLAPFLQVGERRAYDTSAAPLHLLYVGRLAPEKQLDTMLRGVAAAREQGADVLLRLVGSGGEGETLQRLVAELELSSVVTFVPWTDDVASEMAAADLFVFSSAHEGYGLVLLEAMATGLPIVTSDVGCVGEVVEDGEHGLVLREVTPEAVGKAIAALAAGPERRAACGRAAHTTAQTFATTPEQYAADWVADVARAMRYDRG